MEKLDINPGDIFLDNGYYQWHTQVICVSEHYKTGNKLITCQRNICAEKENFRIFTIPLEDFIEIIDYKDAMKKEHRGPRFKKLSCKTDGVKIITEINKLKAKLSSERFRHNRTQKELNVLQKWVKDTSKCKTCGGNSGMTFGLNNCKECGLAGTCPWGG